MTQQIRPSQFVITYGPGAILEGPQGPRIIPSPELAVFSSGAGLKPGDYEITDQRMSTGLLGGARIFRLPTNAEFGISAKEPLYRTRAFPEWRLCHNDHQNAPSVLFRAKGCPLCGASRRRVEPIRFIAACPQGHMDDADWHLIVHGGSAACKHNNWFLWHGGGGTLSQIELECPQCHLRKKLGDAYGLTFPCTGRYPEREPLRSGPLYQDCSGRMKLIQRQASNLRIPEIRTLFTIPPRYTKLHNLLESTPVLSALTARKDISSPQQLEEVLNDLKARGLIKQETRDEILRHEWPEIQRAIHDVLSPVPTGYGDLIMEEYHALIRGSVEGVPPLHGPSTRSQVILEINPHSVRRVAGPNGRRLRVVPISRLRTVIVQIGYRREVDTPQVPARMVDIGFTHPSSPGQRWYPGVEFLGEGIFIMLDDADGRHYDLVGESVNEWLKAYRASGDYPDHVFGERGRIVLHPVFVWWHTLSHLLIRGVSLYAGYSSASIRERVYIEIEGGMVRGGILLYATQPGSEGTLGGLIAQVPNFEDILDDAFDMLHSCSCDPICAENRFRVGGYNGSACYGCLLVSETSCEHRNMWLDRNVLRSNLP